MTGEKELKHGLNKPQESNMEFAEVREKWFKENPMAYEVVTGKTEPYRIDCLLDILKGHDSVISAKDLEIRKLKREVELLRDKNNMILAVFKRTKRALSRMVSITVKPNSHVKDHVINDAKDALNTANNFKVNLNNDAEIKNEVEKIK